MALCVLISSLNNMVFTWNLPFLPLENVSCSVCVYGRGTCVDFVNWCLNARIPKHIIYIWQLAYTRTHWQIHRTAHEDRQVDDEAIECSPFWMGRTKSSNLIAERSVHTRNYYTSSRPTPSFCFGLSIQWICLPFVRGGAAVSHYAKLISGN